MECTFRLQCTMLRIMPRTLNNYNDELRSRTYTYIIRNVPLTVYRVIIFIAVNALIIVLNKK